MRINLNGESHEAEDGATVLRVLEGLAVDPSEVAVMLNSQVVKRSDCGAVVLTDGDCLDVLTFAAGG